MQIRKYTNSLQNFKNVFTFFPSKAFLFIKCREVLHTAKIKCAQNCPPAANFVLLTCSPVCVCLASPWTQQWRYRCGC